MVAMGGYAADLVVLQRVRCRRLGEGGQTRRVRPEHHVKLSYEEARAWLRDEKEYFVLGELCGRSAVRVHVHVEGGEVDGEVVGA